MQELELLHAQEWSAFGKAMGLLAPSLHHAFSMLFQQAPRLSGIACVRGPGNFTGLRLSLATALGLSRSRNAPLAGIDYLPLLADSAWQELPAPENICTSLWVVTHSRGGEVYMQGFAPDASGSLCPLAPPVSVTATEALSQLEKAPHPSLVLGSGLRRNAGVFAVLPQGVTALSSSWDHPTAEALLRHGLRAPYSMEAPAPMYLRDSDAEENIEHIARKQRRDPEAMKTDLERLRAFMGEETGHSSKSEP